MGGDLHTSDGKRCKKTNNYSSWEFTIPNMQVFFQLIVTHLIVGATEERATKLRAQLGQVSTEKFKSTTLEHLFQQFKFPHISDVMDKIGGVKAEDTPEVAMEYVRERGFFSFHEWEAIKFVVMLFLQYAKYIHNFDVEKFIRESGVAPIWNHESNHVWGTDNVEWTYVKRGAVINANGVNAMLIRETLFRKDAVAAGDAAKVAEYDALIADYLAHLGIDGPKQDLLTKMWEHVGITSLFQ